MLHFVESFNADDSFVFLKFPSFIFHKFCWKFNHFSKISFFACFSVSIQRNKVIDQELINERQVQVCNNNLWGLFLLDKTCFCFATAKTISKTISKTNWKAKNENTWRQFVTRSSKMCMFACHFQRYCYDDHDNDEPEILIVPSFSTNSDRQSSSSPIHLRNSDVEVFAECVFGWSF